MSPSDISKIIKKDTEHITQVRRITWISVFINIGLAVIKFVLGIAGASQAVVADAVHSLSDLVTDVIVLVGVKFWIKLPDEGHPYGHRRIETVVTGMIGVALAGVAIGIGYNALTTIYDSHNQRLGWVAFWGSVISVVVKELLYHWTVHVGKRVKSQAVIANAWHHRSDAFSSIPVAIAVTVAILFPKWILLDHITAFIVAIFIFSAAWSFIRSAFEEIIDTSASRQYRRKIKNIAVSTNGVESVHAIRTRRIGSGWAVDLHVQVNPAMTVRKGHEISEEVKKNLFEKGQDVVDVVVHLEPSE